MTGDDWTPDPQLLAAFFDGELDMRADRAGQRRHVETWLEAHPLEAAEEREIHARIAEALQDTAPPEPEPAAWRRLQKQLEDSQQGLPRRHRRRRGMGRQWLLLAAAAASVLLVGWFAWPPRQPPEPLLAWNPPPVQPVQPLEIFEVAEASEVVILSVAGEDAKLVAVGTFPIHRLDPLDLADPGDVTITNVNFTGDDASLHLRTDGESRPMIWVSPRRD